MHVDRLNATSAAFAATHDVVGIEFFTSSETYEWARGEPPRFPVQTIGSRSDSFGRRLRYAWRILAMARRHRLDDMFLCHYDRPYIFLAAILLRLSGRRVYLMGCSKFDDLPRFAWREALKSIVLRPYNGALSSGSRARDYLRFLGIPAEHIVGGYNTLSVDRMRRQRAETGAPHTPWSHRSFVAVARLVPKKNLQLLVRAFALLSPEARRRQLVICGSGPLEGELRALADTLGVAPQVEFTGFVQTEEVSRRLSEALLLALPSIEEQFGNVVIEAEAFALPVLLSDQCGARDQLVRSGMNGFVVESDNAAGLSYFMDLLANDEALWNRMSASAHEFAGLADVSAFTAGVEQLIGLRAAQGLPSLNHPPHMIPEKPAPAVEPVR